MCVGDIWTTGIAYVTYDTNNTPSAIYFTNGNETRYAYGTSGQKLRVTHYVAKPNITRTFGVKPIGSTQDEVLFAGQTDYLLGGSLVVKDGSIDKVLFDGGYAKAARLGSTTYGFSPYYYNKDHLGNIREVVNMGGTVQQVTNYYPFGAPYADPNAVMGATVQPYKYIFSIEREKRKLACSSEREKKRQKVNGKELDRMHGLDTYDYGARQYDPILARWDRVDPVAERKPWQSPYVYGRNNPVRYIDPDGRDEWDKVVGYIIGAATNIIPFSGAVRDLYTPTDASDYNTALQSTDNAFMVVGGTMSDLGKGGAAIGVATATMGGGIIVGSGGAATMAGAPTAVAGVALTRASATAGLAGTLINMNATSNSSKGYKRGKTNPIVVIIQQKKNIRLIHAPRQRASMKRDSPEKPEIKEMKKEIKDAQGTSR